MPLYYRIRGRREGEGEKAVITVVYQTNDDGRAVTTVGRGKSHGEAWDDMLNKVKRDGYQSDHLDREKTKGQR